MLFRADKPILLDSSPPLAGLVYDSDRHWTDMVFIGVDSPVCIYIKVASICLENSIQYMYMVYVVVKSK